jgi:hypothetical protein
MHCSKAAKGNHALVAIMRQPRLTLREIDRKVHQILINTLNPKILGTSLVEIKEKVSAAINEVTDLPPPKGTTILEISKLCKGGFTILFKDKEVTKWLQDLGVKFEFAISIAPDATITK